MTPLQIKTIVSIIATLMTFAISYPYIRAIIAKRVVPHFFSWFIWGITTLLAFLGQVAGNGGIGTLSGGFSAAITFIIAFYAFRHSKQLSIQKLDWFYFVAALAAIPVWLITSNPLWAVIMMTVIDLLGFGPTLRNAYQYPDREDAGYYLLFGLRSILVIYALETYSVTTVLFPAAIGVGCLVVVAVIRVMKRKILNVANFNNESSETIL